MSKKKSQNFDRYLLLETRNEEGDNIMKKGSIPLDQVKESTEYKDRTQTKDHWVKRKFAVCFAYCGTAYQGLQINPDCKSIEAEMERALFLSGCFTEDNYGFLQKLQWNRAARTDRGVHALGQCCSMKLIAPLDHKERECVISDINRLLPLDIRCLALTKVTRQFNAHIQCQSRKYSYLLPTYLFLDIAQCNAWLKEAYEVQGPIVDCARIGGFVEPGSNKYLGYDALQHIRNKFSAYRITKEKLALVHKCLAFFEGTKSYHNFTTGKDASDDSSKRYIMSCKASEPYLLSKDGTIISQLPLHTANVTSDTDSSIEWICITLVGQSFVLNQIRKMVGVVVDIVRGVTEFETLPHALNPALRMEVAMAPPLGLYLNQLFFDVYNTKQKQNLAKQIKDAEIAKARAKKKQPSTQHQHAHKTKMSIEEIKASALAAVQKALQGEIVANNNAVETDTSNLDTSHRTVEITNNNSHDENAHKRHKIESMNNSSSSSSSSNVTQTSSSVDVVKVNKDEEEEEEEVNTAGEPILWWSDEPTKMRIEAFRKQHLWPHIAQQESSSLCFLFYLDSLRIKNKNMYVQRVATTKTSSKVNPIAAATADSEQLDDDIDNNNNNNNNSACENDSNNEYN